MDLASFDAYFGVRNSIDQMNPTPQLRALIYQEDGEWVAHLLEMDLVGSADTPEKAMTELVEAVDAQLTYCAQHKISPFLPAPAKYFELWEATQRQEIESLVQESPPTLAAPRRTSYLNPPKRTFPLRDGWMAQACPG